MKRRIVLALALIAFSSSARAQDEVDRLIEQLAHPDPGMREIAMQELSERGDAVRPALKRAQDHPRPAVADAARMLLMKLPWTAPDDPQEAQALLRNYGTLSPDHRTRQLSMLARHPKEAVRRVALRVAREEPSDDVLWDSLADAPLDDAWGTALEEIEPSGARAAVLYLMARKAEARQPMSAAPLLRTLLDRELDAPVAPRQRIGWAVRTLRPAMSATPGDLRKLAQYYRYWDSLPPDAGESESPLLELLLLQARYGPLPGVRRDVEEALQRSVSPEMALAAAQVMRELGVDWPGEGLVESALAPDRLTPEYAMSLERGASWLMRVGRLDLAERALLLAASRDQDPAFELAGVQANLRLHDLYLRLDRLLESADRLERTLDRLPENTVLTIRRGGQQEGWPESEARGTVIYLRYRDAERRKDQADQQRLALQLADGASTDPDVFLGVLPTLEKAARPEQVDAYFDRSFEATMQRLKAAPDDPVRLNELAWLCARSGRKLDVALEHAEKAVAARPDEAAYLDTLAEAKFRLGRVREAIELEEKAARLAPDEPFMKEQLERFRAAATTRPSD